MSQNIIGYLVYSEYDDTPRISQPTFVVYKTLEDAQKKFNDLCLDIPPSLIKHAEYRGTGQVFPYVSINEDYEDDETLEPWHGGIIPLLEGDEFQIYPY